MRFDDLFEQGQRYPKQNRDHQYLQEDDYQTSQPFNQYDDIKQQLLTKLRINPKLKALLIITAAIIIVGVVIAVVLLFPLILKLLRFIAENGLQGLINTIWNGIK